MVQYNENTGNEVNITLRNGGDHEQLLNGLVDTLRMAVQCPQPNDTDKYSLVTMLDFLKQILPDEWQLDKGMEAAMKMRKKK